MLFNDFGFLSIDDLDFDDKDYFTSKTTKEKKVTIDSNGTTFNEGVDLNNNPPRFLSKEAYNMNKDKIKRELRKVGLPEELLQDLSYESYVKLYKDNLNKYM